MKIIITIFAIFSIISFSAFAKENNHNIQADTNVTEIINYLKNNIPKYLKENDIAGASAVIVSKKGEIWAQGFGHLSKDSKVAVTPETIFCVGSISKIFTTTGILIAAQNGTIDINKPIKYYLPNFKINSVFSKSPADKITILDLLSFRAGLADKIQNAKNSPLLKQDIQDIEKTWIRFPLGQRFAYSEPTYDLAGYILAKKEKISFSKSMEKLVFNPLGMNSTTFSIKKIKADKNRATGYIPKINKIYLTVRPSGSAYSNAVDIGKFISFQLNNGSINGKQLLSKNNIKLMRTVPDKTNYQRTGFGLPVISVNTGNGIVYSYSGLYHGFNSWFIWFPKKDIGFGILTNKRNGLNNFAPIDKFIFNKLGIKNYINNLLGKVIIKKPIKKPITKKELKYWTGSYISTTEMPNIYITLKNDNLIISINNDISQLIYLGNNEFYSIKDRNLYKFYKNGNGFSKYILNMGNGNTWSYNDGGENQSKGPNKTTWKKYIGNYNVSFYNRPDQTAKFFIKNGYLYLNFLHNEYRLKEYKPGVFATSSGRYIDFTQTPLLLNNSPMVKIDN